MLLICANYKWRGNKEEIITIIKVLFLDISSLQQQSTYLSYLNEMLDNHKKWTVPLKRSLTEHRTTYRHGGAVFAHAATQDDQKVVVGWQQKSPNDAQDWERLQFNAKHRQLAQYRYINDWINKQSNQQKKISHPSLEW